MCAQLPWSILYCHRLLIFPTDWLYYQHQVSRDWCCKSHKHGKFTWPSMTRHSNTITSCFPVMYDYRNNTHKRLWYDKKECKMYMNGKSTKFITHALCRVDIYIPFHLSISLHFFLLSTIESNIALYTHTFTYAKRNVGHCSFFFCVFSLTSSQ